MAKTKGLTTKEAQITFVGDKHPNTGQVFSLSWEQIAKRIEVANKKHGVKVLSLRLKPSGIDCFIESTSFSFWGEI